MSIRYIIYELRKFDFSVVSSHLYLDNYILAEVSFSYSGFPSYEEAVTELENRGYYAVDYVILPVLRKA